MNNLKVSAVVAAAISFAVPGWAQDKPPLVDTIIPVPEPVDQTEGAIDLGNGVELWHWDTGGDGEVVVFAHPFSGNHASWMYQQPAFAKAGYRVIGYSRRGYYQSSYGPKEDFGTQAGDLAMLLDKLGIEKIHMVGSAAGGTTALDFALSYPDRTLSAVVVASLLSISDDDYKAAVGSARGDWFGPLPDEIKELSASFRVTYPEGVAKWKEVYDLNPPRPEQMPPRQPPQATINWETLAKNEVPMLLMTGGADLYQPPELLRRVGARVANADVVTVRDAGHAIFAEQPDEFNRIVLDFIGKH